MKKRIAKAIVTVITIAVLAGCNSMTAQGYNKTDSTAVSSSMMAAVSGLYKMDYIEVHKIQSIDDFERLTPILENRNGKVIIEISNGTVLDSTGNGIDSCGYYHHYDTEKFSKGDHVQSVFIYNPDTNYIDDILYRMDVLIE